MLNVIDIHFMTLDEIAKAVSKSPTDVDNYEFDQICREHGLSMYSLTKEDMRTIKRLVNKYNKNK